MPQPLNTTRHTIEVMGRKVHYRRSGDGPAVVMLHESPRSSAALELLMSFAPEGMTLFALDTPGCGDSDPLTVVRPDAGDYGDAVAATMDALGIDRAPVYGTHTGAAIAMALAIRHPHKVARLVIDGLAVFNAVERVEMLQSYLTPFVPLVDGTHLAWLWARVRDQFTFFPWNYRGTGTRLWRDMLTPAQLHLVAMDLLRAGDNYRAPYAAAFNYRPDLMLDALRMPTHLCVRTDDMLLTHLPRLPAIPASITVEELSPDRPLWGARLWQLLAQDRDALPNAPAASDPALPAVGLGDTFAGTGGQRLHLRGNLGGSGRPLVLLHDSPGAARGLDAHVIRLIGQRPVLVPDLPGHGDSGATASTVEAAVQLLHAGLQQTGLGEAEVMGFGTGAVLARALAGAFPRHYQQPGDTVVAAPVAGDTRSDLDFTPRADGGHLYAAWFHARDNYIHGPVWQRQAGVRHDFGDDLDVPLIHRNTVDFLKEAPEARALRAALLA